MSSRVCVKGFLAGICFLLISPVFSFAVDPKDSMAVQTLDPVVVSATKTPVPISRVTSAVEVITEEDIKKRKIVTVVDALRLSPGLAVFSNGGPGTTATVRIRGAGQEQTLVLLDGAVMNSSTLGEFNFSHLTVDNIERIEVLRGAQSMLWGSDAIGGVINITTKRGRGVPKASGFFEYGSFNTIREGGQLSGQSGMFDYSLAISRWDTTGISAINYRRGATEKDSYRNWTSSARVGVALPKDGRLDFNFRWTNSDIMIDAVTGSGTVPRDRFKNKTIFQRYNYSGSYQQRITNWWDQILTLASYEENSITLPRTGGVNLITGAPEGPTSSVFQTETESNRIEWQNNFQIFDPLLVTAGYQFREQLGETVGSFPQKIVSSHAGFLQGQLNLWERIFATTGVRYDSFNVVGSATTYRVTGGYFHPETQTKLRASYATGFRAPNINALFSSAGNPDVVPEKSQSFDAGVDQFFFDRNLRLSAGYFWNRFRDFIDFVASSGMFQNIISAQSKGWELGITYRLEKEWTYLRLLEIQGQYTYTLTRDLLTGTRLARWPVDQASLIVTYKPIDLLSFVVSFRFVGSSFNSPDTAENNSQRVGSYEVVNVAATYDVSENFQVYTRVDNLLDEEYEEIQFFGTPVRSVYGGVRVNFDLPFLAMGNN